LTNPATIVFIEVTPLCIDEILTYKSRVDGYSRRSIQNYATVIRGFLKYADSKGWCQKNLGNTIKVPRVYRHESLPYSPNWDDIKIVLANTKTNRPTDIRNYAILMLLSVYGLRCSEVKSLCLEHIDWKNELLYRKQNEVKFLRDWAEV